MQNRLFVCHVLHAILYSLLSDKDVSLLHILFYNNYLQAMDTIEIPAEEDDDCFELQNIMKEPNMVVSILVISSTRSVHEGCAEKSVPIEI